MKNLALKIQLAAVSVLIGMASSACAGDAADNPFISNKLLTSEIQDAIGFEFFNYALQRRGGALHPNGGTKPGTYSDEDVKAALLEFDRIVLSINQSIEKALELHPQKVNASISKEAWESAFDSRTVSWAKKNQEFSVATQNLGNLAFLLWSLAPDRLAFPAGSSQEYDRVFGQVGGANRYQVHLVLNSKDGARLLPPRFDIPSLRRQEIELLSSGQTIRFPDGKIFRTALEIRQWLAPDMQPQIKQSVIPDLEKLNSRLRCLARKPSQPCD